MILYEDQFGRAVPPASFPDPATLGAPMTMQSSKIFGKSPVSRDATMPMMTTRGGMMPTQPTPASSAFNVHTPAAPPPPSLPQMSPKFRPPPAPSEGYVRPLFDLPTRQGMIPTDEPLQPPIIDGSGMPRFEPILPPEGIVKGRPIEQFNNNTKILVGIGVSVLLYLAFMPRKKG